MPNQPQLTEEYWRQRAAEMRAFARNEKDAVNRRAFERIAALYEDVANRHAEIRAVAEKLTPDAQQQRPGSGAMQRHTDG